MSNTHPILNEPVGQILPGPARIEGEVDPNDPKFSSIVQQMRQHGDLSTIGGTLCDANGVPIIPRANAGNLNDLGSSSAGTSATSSAVPQYQSTTETYSTVPALATAPAITTTAPPPTATTASSGFGSSSDYQGFQQTTDAKPHHNVAQELLAHHSGHTGRKGSASGTSDDKDFLGRRRSSATPAFHEPTDGRRVSTSGYEGQYHPSSFTRTNDLGYTTNPLGGADVQETSTGGAKIVGGRGYLVTGETGPEGLTSAPLGDFTETGPGGGDRTEGRSLKDRIAGLVDRADERKGGTSTHNTGL